jgi:hypothetical protein
VPLPVGEVFLLGPASLALPVGGPVGLLAGQGRGGLGEGVVVAGLGELPAVQQPPGAVAEFGHPVAGRLLPGGGLGQPLLSELALVGGVGEQPAAVGWGVAEQGGDPVALGAQLALAHLPQGQRRGGVDGELLGAVAAPDGDQVLVDAVGLSLGDVQFQLDWPGLGGDDVEEGGLAGRPSAAPPDLPLRSRASRARAGGPSQARLKRST